MSWKKHTKKVNLEFGERLFDQLTCRIRSGIGFVQYVYVRGHVQSKVKKKNHFVISYAANKRADMISKNAGFRTGTILFFLLFPRFLYWISNENLLFSQSVNELKNQKISKCRIWKETIWLVDMPYSIRYRVCSICIRPRSCPIKS